MTVFSWLAASTLLLASGQPILEPDRCHLAGSVCGSTPAARTNADSVSLLQSRGIRVDHNEDEDAADHRHGHHAGQSNHGHHVHHQHHNYGQHGNHGHHGHHHQHSHHVQQDGVKGLTADIDAMTKEMSTLAKEQAVLMKAMKEATDQMEKEKAANDAVMKTAKAKASMLSHSAVLQTQEGRSNNVWSVFLAFLLVLGVCWLVCAAMTFMRLQRKEDLLENRITSVLQPQFPQKVREDNVQPPEVCHPPSSSPQLFAHSPFAAMLDLNLNTRSQTAPVMQPAAVVDIPPPLDVASSPLQNKIHLTVARDGMVLPLKGGDIVFNSEGAPLLRANARQVDGDIWLDISFHDDGALCGMVRLTNKQQSTTLPIFGPRPWEGPEVYGPDGSLYGTIEQDSKGSTQLVSSTTAEPVLSLAGDAANSLLAIRTRSGIELAKVGQAGSELGIEVNKGGDLALIICFVLTVTLSNQV